MVKWLRPVAVLVLMLAVRTQAAEPLVALDADGLPSGPLTAWENAGSLKGTFRNHGTRPQVRVVDGVKAAVFGGKDHMTADFTAPAGITGDKAWTCVVRMHSTQVTGERSLVFWASRPYHCLELEYGDAPMWGAIGTWNDPHTLGWNNRVPQTGQWHILAYSYSGGRDGQMQAWCDGELRARKKGSLATKSGKAFVIGACINETADGKLEYMHHIVGAIAMVRIYDRTLTPLEIWNASGMELALPAEPERDHALETLTSTLRWFKGNAEVRSYDIYLGTDRQAEGTASAGKADDWTRIYKGNQPADKTQLGPVALSPGKTYYWRVDQRDASGKAKWRGQVSSFSTETGQAAEPGPIDGGFFVEGGKKRLCWKPGKFAVKQNIYIGASAAEVLAKKNPDIADLPATTTSIPLPINDPPLGKSFYWRVESINRDDIPVTAGDVWSFRTVRKHLKVYLLGGQSNMTGCCSVNGIPQELIGKHKSVIIFARGGIKAQQYGWDHLRDGLGDAYGDYDGRGCFGPELSFGHHMASSNPDEVIALIKCAWGATNLQYQWRPPSAGGKTGELYTSFIKAVHDGIAALEPAFVPEISGMLWMQGEADALSDDMYKDYEKNLELFIGDIRKEFKKPVLPFVPAQIADAPAYKPPKWGAEVRQAQTNVAAKVPHTATFQTADYKLVDPSHYDAAGMISIGERFAKAMKELETVAAHERDALSIWFDAPAARWEAQALPIGNSFIGGMIYGGVAEERVQFNEKSLWTGNENDTGSYQNFGDILIRLGGDVGATSNGYVRSLDIGRALANVAYSQDAVNYRREAFCSNPDQVMVLRFTADKPGRYSGAIRMQDAHGAAAKADGARLTVRGALGNGIQYEA